MESEPARVPGLAANECALRCGIRVSPLSALRSWEMKSPSSTMERQPDWRRDLPRKQLSFGLASSTLALSALGSASRLVTAPGLNPDEPRP